MRYLIGLIVAALLLSSAGCGGHKKGAVPTSLRNGEKTRALKVGDKMVFDLSLSGNSNGKDLGTKTGAVSVEVKSGFKHGSVPSNIERHFEVLEQMSIGDVPTTQISWMGQDADGATYLLGRLDEGTEWALVKDKALKPDIPAVLSADSSWQSTIHLSNGKTETNKLEVVGKEKVKTQAGEFEAYKTRVSTTISDGNVQEGYAWLRPEFPRPIKLDLDVRNTKAHTSVTTRVQEVLKSYKLAE